MFGPIRAAFCLLLIQWAAASYPADWMAKGTSTIAARSLLQDEEAAGADRTPGRERRRERRRMRREKLGELGELLPGSDGTGAGHGDAWPPPHCKGLKPASAPKVAGSTRRGLLSEAPTKLLVERNPPDEKLKDQVYDYLRDFMASDETCTPRAFEGTKQRCSGMGGGLSCRGQKDPVCKKSPLRGPDGGPPISPSTSIFRGPKQFQPKEWGRCAFIATGENVLKAEWGSEINLHDTVIRYNTPIKGFEKHVGTKTSLMYSKSKYKTTAKPTLGYITGGKEKVKGDAYMMRRQAILTLRDQAHRIWFTARGIKEGKAAAGLTRAMALVKSGLCSEISLYGFSTSASPKRGGKYFQKKAIVTPGHTIDWDGWLLKALMDLGYLCAYGE